MALRGAIPSPSSDELDLTLTYGNATLGFDSGDEPAYVVSDFPQGVFTLVVPDEAWPRRAPAGRPRWGWATRSRRL